MPIFLFYVTFPSFILWVTLKNIQEREDMFVGKMLGL